jgi:hypothetical protein
MADSGVYGVSKRGKRPIIYRGFKFWYHKVLKNDRVVWRCCKYRTLNCKATVVADGLHIEGNKNTQHTHDGNNSQAVTRKAVRDMKLRQTDSLATPSATRAAMCSHLADHVLMALPKKATLSRSLRFHRQKAAESGNDPCLPYRPTATLPCPSNSQICSVRLGCRRRPTDYIQLHGAPGRLGESTSLARRWNFQGSSLAILSAIHTALSVCARYQPRCPVLSSEE